MSPASTPDAGFWPAIAAHRKLTAEEAERFRATAARLAALTSPALADWLLSSSTDAAGPLIPPENVQRSRLLNRFTRAQGLRWLAVVDEAGIDVVCLKGMAAGSLIYPDPDLRGMTDVDLLVRGRDLKALVMVLAAKGFVFKTALGTPPWGHIGDAGFHPFVAPGGTFSFDLHVQPDDYPIHRGLSAEQVFADAQPVTVDGQTIRMPSGPHFLLMAMANAARDKLGPVAMKSVVDAFVYLARTGGDPGWPAILAAAQKGRFGRTARGVVACLSGLGVPAERLPADTDSLSAMAQEEVARAVAGLADCFSIEPGKFALQRREVFLLAPPHVIAWRYGRRLRGLLKPWPGVPAF
jgi:hypothetical protein